MRRLDKRACRRVAGQGWNTDRSRGLFMAKSVEYIVRTAIKTIARQKTLVLYLYDTEFGDPGPLIPSYTVFQGREDYITLARKDGALVWRTSKLEHLDNDYRFTDKCVFFSKNDEQQVLKYCRAQTQSGFVALEHLQEEIKDQRELMRRHAKQRITIAKMKRVPPMPRGIKEWLRREIMPSYIFYDYQKKGPVQGYCTACRHMVEVRPKHNQMGVCPHCKQPVQFKSRGRRGYICDRETAVVVQQLDNRTLLLRILKVYFTYRKDDVPEQDISEAIRIFSAVDEAGQYSEEVFHHNFEGRDLTPWKTGYPPIRYLYQENFYASTCGHLFCRILAKELKGTPWQYSQLQGFYESDHIPLSVETFLKKSVVYSQIELLLKMGYYGFTADFIYRSIPYHVNASEKKPHRFFGIQPEEWKFLLRRGLDKDDLALMQRLNVFPMPYSKRIELFLWCQQNGVDSYPFNMILRLMSPSKMVGYMQKQYEILKDYRTARGQIRYGNLPSVVYEYRDYLGLCQSEGCNMESSVVLFPRNVKEAHDRLTRRIKIRESKEQRRKFQQVLKQLAHSLDFEYEGLVIMQPACMEDVTAEGKALSHCVGGYIGNMADGCCIILFIRRKDDIQTPFYTVEVQGTKVVQVKGADNGEPTPEVSDFMTVWENQVLKKQCLAAA